jgi:hypothetical protein
VEVDAIDPETLRRLVREAIRTHVNELELRRLEEIEKAERQSLRN